MNVAIIVAAGSGSRAGAGRAKQFRLLAGVPLIIHTLRRFQECESIGEIIAVMPAAAKVEAMAEEAAEEAATDFLALTKKYQVAKVTRVVAGGATRTESVWRGLQAVDAEQAEIIAVHDGVRPFVTAAEIDRTVRAAEESGAAILAALVIDTIKEIADGRIARTRPRETLRRALTPQCFRYELLRRAYEHARAHHIEATDDSALVELLGAPVTVVEGDARNIKITRPEDFALAEILIQESSQKSGASSQ